MALDPQVADILARVARAQRPEFHEQTPQEARLSYLKAVRVLDIAKREVARVDDFAVRGPARPIPLRVYVPVASSALQPATVYFHGGGFTIGDLDTHDAVCRMLALEGQCIVIAVDYRLAPEFPFPAAVDDALGALSWIVANARRLGVDHSRIAVAGDSAGGTLAAVCAIDAARRGVTLALQLLIYPGTSALQDTASHRSFGKGYLLDGQTIQWFFGNYLPDRASRHDWRFSPLDARPALDLAGVAPATILLAGYDPLHDEGVAYAGKLKEAGVPVQLLDYPGMIHGFFQFGGYLDVARTAHRDAAMALRQALAAPN